MEDDRYGRNFTIRIDVNGKGQIVWTKECRGYTCLSNPHELKTKLAVEVKSPIILLNNLLQIMIPHFHGSPLSVNLSEMVEKRKLSDTRTEIIVSAHPYTGNDIPELISRMCDHHIYQNISPEDANKIISRLGLSQFVFCVQGDPESGACLVVLKEVEPFYSYSDNDWLPQPREIFRKAYEEFNKSRTVVMTPAQRDTLLSEEMESNVQFTSVLSDGRIEVVFRQEAIQTVVPEIKKQVEIDNLRRRLEELTSSSK